MKPRDLIGQRFGRLTAVSRTSETKPSGQIYSRWLCRCDCGQTTSASLSDLTGGNTKSCGCLKKDGDNQKTHGLTGSGVHNSWIYMRNRCLNPENKAYSRYGGRGITVCERWGKFENFIFDMGDRPAGMEIDRIDNNGNYEPSNCRWASSAEQARNRRSNIQITLEGRTQCLLDWCLEKKMPYASVRARIKVLGWTPEVALTKPIR